MNRIYVHTKNTH